jgi:hypothetical protein
MKREPNRQSSGSQRRRSTVHSMKFAHGGPALLHSLDPLPHLLPGLLRLGIGRESAMSAVAEVWPDVVWVNR